MNADRVSRDRFEAMRLKLATSGVTGGKAETTEILKRLRLVRPGSARRRGELFRLERSVA